MFQEQQKIAALEAELVKANAKVLFNLCVCAASSAIFLFIEIYSGVDGIVAIRFGNIVMIVWIYDV